MTIFQWVYFCIFLVFHSRHDKCLEKNQLQNVAICVIGRLGLILAENDVKVKFELYVINVFYMIFHHR